MPRQTDDASTARPQKRRRSPQSEQPASSTPLSTTSVNGASTPTSTTGPRPLNRKRIPESQSRPTKRVRDDLTGGPRRSSPPRSPSPPPPTTASAPRKRPGAGSRLDPTARLAAQAAQRAREEEARREIEGRGGADLVSSHYNAVPQRGREWRKTDSSIRGLRSFNNWVKSAVIQKFSMPEDGGDGRPVLVLDLGCGKGGDLQKWQAAPRCPALYVGVDPAGVSIEQARERYGEMQRRRRRGRDGRPSPLFDGHFYVRDCFGESLGGLQVVQQVGFDAAAGPGGGPIGVRWGRGGFDVVSCMFALHYSFENEERARGLLKNVAGALRKGGRFLGVMPNSDVLSAHVEKHLRAHLKGEKVEGKAKTNGEEKSMYDDDWDPEAPSNGVAKDDDEDDWDPEKPSAPAIATTNNDGDDWDPEKPSGGAGEAPKTNGDDDDNWDPEAPSTSTPAAVTPAQNGHAKTPLDLPPLEWSNSIYRVKFTQSRPLPTDGVFRPPYGWKYFFYLEEAVDVPEFVVPWEGFRALAEEYGLELQYRKSFADVWEEFRGDRELAPLAERMGVVDRNTGKFLVSGDEMEAASFYHAFCFYKI